MLYRFADTSILFNKLMVCLMNLCCPVIGWDLKIARLRRLQMALDYLKYDDINE